MTDARNFLINTEYSMDKVVYIKTGSMSVPNGTNDTVVIEAHNLPFTPLPYLVWSNTSDFSVSFTSSDDVVYPSATYQRYDIKSDSTNISIDRFNSSGSTKTVYYRIFGLAPSTASIDSVVPATSSVGDNFIINTDYNYLKLGFSGTTTTSFTHSLGYYPVTLAWTEISGVIRPANNATASNISAVNSGVYVTTTQLVYDDGGSPGATIHYRIYMDEL